MVLDTGVFSLTLTPVITVQAIFTLNLYKKSYQQIYILNYNKLEANNFFSERVDELCLMIA